MAKTKIVKKRWRPVYALKPLQDRFIGELYTATPQDMEGRYILINLAAVTNNYAHQHFNIKFRVEKVEGDKGLASVYGYYMQQAYEKRVIRRRREKISDSFGVKTKDGVLVVVKPLIITTSKCSRNVETKIRKYARFFYASKAAEMNYDEFMDNIINAKLQSELRKNASKIMPIAASELRRAYRSEKFALVITPKMYAEEFSKKSKKAKK